MLCTLKPGQATLAPGTRTGSRITSRQYPDLALATAGAASRRDAAARARPRCHRALARRPEQPRRAGSTPTSRGAPRATTPSATSTPSIAATAPTGTNLDPSRPESLIYATEPGRKPVLIGAMFSVPRGVLGPTPGGPIDRWHSHLVCVRGDKRGLAPLASGAARQGRS